MSGGYPESPSLTSRLNDRSGTPGGEQMADVSLDDFKAEVLSFLDANAPLRQQEEAFQWGKGRDNQAMFEEVDREVEKKQLVKAKEFRAKRYDAGLAWITGPKEFGGRELSQAHDRLYAQLESRY